MNLLQKSKTAFNILTRHAQGNAHYGKTWEVVTNKWYNDMHNSDLILHADFVEYLKSKDITSVLEVGCGTGIYPIKHKELFKDYTGFDFSNTAITYCKENSDFDFMCGDFLKTRLSQRFDLIFSHSVIDHIYDIGDFVSRIAQSCTKYAFISTSRGYYDKISNHEMQWNPRDGCYYSDISMSKIKKTLLDVSLDEKQFHTRPLEKYGIIEIDKTVKV